MSNLTGNTTEEIWSALYNGTIKVEPSFWNYMVAYENLFVSKAWFFILIGILSIIGFICIVRFLIRETKLRGKKDG